MEGITIAPFSYRSEIHTVSGKKGAVTVENLSPQLSEEERSDCIANMEAGLFEVFIKYMNQKEYSVSSEAAAV